MCSPVSSAISFFPTAFPTRVDAFSQNVTALGRLCKRVLLPRLCKRVLRSRLLPRFTEACSRTCAIGYHVLAGGVRLKAL